MKRRKFVQNSALTSLGFMGLQSFIYSCKNREVLESVKYDKGYGPLIKDRDGILNLPRQFSYKVISRRGERMSDGLKVPGLADGMATFKGLRDKVILVRNHEISPRDTKNGAFGMGMELLEDHYREKFYDFGRGKATCLGGTTTLVYNTKKQKVERQFLSLTGTIRNCAGGPTPWGSWITCEENTNKADHLLEKDHGYNFEVPASPEIRLYDPVPLMDMGRFNHEAVCVDPRTGIVYQTEDRPDSLIYRFIPDTYGNLHGGGKLQVLTILDIPGADTRNWKESKGEKFKVRQKYNVKWMDIDHIQSPNDDLRYRGHENGAAVFARGEGMWFGNNEVYFACTNGGRKQLGQIFRYIPSPDEGRETESAAPASLEVFIEPNDSDLIESCDNVTVAANGDLVICEDKTTPRIVGVTPKGQIYHLAKNVGYASEFAGATFSPDGKVLFVNIQGPGLTLAIQGPWKFNTVNG